MFALLALLVSSQASADLQRPRSGPTLELGTGPALAGRPAGFALAGQGSAGWWFGTYDDDYALGRVWAVVATARVDYLTSRGQVRITPMLEVRRGMDLLVLAPHFFVAGGAVVDDGSIGASARVGGGLKFRRTRRTGFIARLGAGADLVAGKIAPAVGLTLGVGWSSPVD